LNPSGCMASARSWSRIACSRLRNSLTVSARSMAVPMNPILWLPRKRRPWQNQPPSSQLHRPLQRKPP